MLVAALVLLGGLLPHGPVQHALARPPIEPCPQDLGDTGRAPTECPPGAPIGPDGPSAAAAIVPAGFSESIALSGLAAPTAVEFAADGRVFVAEKSGVIKVFDSLADTTPTSYGGLQTNTLDLWDRGLLGMTIDPSLKDPSLPLRPWVYVLYTYDHILGSAANPPRWGDACPTPPGPTTDGCVASARLSRLSVSGSTISGPEAVLIEDWCQQFTSHSIGNLQFGSDGALYVSGGDAADFNREDWGQWGGTQGNPPVTPRNPCGDPPNDAMNPPTAEGGALRSQDLRTDPGAGGASYVNTVLADAPRAYWRLGETSGTLADDAVGSANGTYTGGFTLNQPGALTGDPDRAVALNGSTGYVRVPQQALPSSLTWEAWAKPTAYPGDTALVGQWDGTSGSMLYLTSDAGGRVYLWINGSFISAAAPAAGAWHHFVGTYNGTSAAIYIDGGLAAGPTPLAGPLTSAPRFLEMGTYNNAGGGKLNAAVDEVALYPSALSATRIAAHFAAATQPSGGSADPTTLDGAILRVDPTTGAGVPGNPFFSSPDANARRIIAYGLRNPFRVTFRPGTNELWVGDVGWTTWEELNKIPNATDGTFENFGWPCYEGSFRQSGYDGANLSICENLYSAPGGTVTSPVYAYNHSAKVVDTDTCPTGSSSITGVAFYPTTGGSYPARYSGGVFFADHSRNCIWFIPRGTNGEPDPAQREVFIQQAANPVDLVIGPGNDLFYVDFDTGTIRRVSAIGGNQPPTAVMQANPTSGPAPLTVQFDGSGSSDPEGLPLTYAWDLDNDGSFDDGAAATASRTYSSPGNVTARLRVTDAGLATGTDSKVISVGNSPPTPVISTPTAGTTWKVGDAISFSGSATDPQDGTLPASALTWTLVLQHCPSNCHAHTIQTFNGVASGSFTAPDHEYPSYLELTLTATDSVGTSASVTRRLDPQTVVLTFQSSPTGLSLAVNATSSTTQFQRTVIVGSANSVSAPSPQTLGGTTYSFASWSDGGAQTHTITAPATNATLTASYTGTTSLSFFPTADANIRANQATKNFGTQALLRVRLNQSRVYLKFAVTGLSAAPTSAKLRLWVTGASPNGGSVFRLTNTTWTETGITWNNAPAISGTPLSSVGTATAGTWVEFDVGAAVTGNGTYTFAISNGANDAADYASRETTGTTSDPVLVVTP